MKLNKVLPVLGLIAFFGINLFARFYGLENSPSSLGFDEAGLGYNAYSLLKTGRDEWGYRLPLSLRSFDDYKPALYSYTAIPFIAAFGLTQASTRMPSAFWGAVAALFTLLIFKQISKTKWSTTLLIGLFITLSPWRLHFSRVALETNLSASFFTIMVWFLTNRQKSWLHKTGFLVFGLLAIYSYHSARVAVPALLLLAASDPLSFTWSKLTTLRTKIFPDLILAAALIIFSLPIFLANGANILTRFNQTNLFSKYYPFTPGEIVGRGNPWLSLTNHPLYYLAGDIFGRLIAYLSPHNLSETFYPWVVKSAMVIIDNGPLGFMGTIFFLFGVVVVLQKMAKDHALRLLPYWLLAGALPAALTWEWFHSFRALNLFPALDLIVGLGVLAVFGWLQSRRIPLWRTISIIALTVLMFVSILFNWFNEINYSVWENNGEFQPGGFREGATALMSLARDYPIVYLDTPQAQSYIFFLFYGKIDPAVIQNTVRDPHHQPGFPDRVFNFGKFVYQKFSWPEEKSKHHFIFYTQSEIKENEFKDFPDTKLRKVIDPFGRWSATIITKD